MFYLLGDMLEESCCLFPSKLSVLRSQMGGRRGRRGHRRIQGEGALHTPMVETYRTTSLKGGAGGQLVRSLSWSVCLLLSFLTRFEMPWCFVGQVSKSGSNSNHNNERHLPSQNIRRLFSSSLHQRQNKSNLHIFFPRESPRIERSSLRLLSRSLGSFHFTCSFVFLRLLCFYFFLFV